MNEFKTISERIQEHREALSLLEEVKEMLDKIDEIVKTESLDVNDSKSIYNDIIALLRNVQDALKNKDERGENE